VTQAAEVYRQIDRLQEEIDRKEDELVLVHGAAERAADALRTTYDDLVAYSRLPIRKRVLSRASSIGWTSCGSSGSRTCSGTVTSSAAMSKPSVPFDSAPATASRDCSPWPAPIPGMTWRRGSRH
jgi:hypothetical protein